MANDLVPISAADDNERKANEPAVMALVQQIRRDIPGAPTDNRLLQTQHYKGVIYKAIDSLVGGVRGCELRVMRRNPQPVFQSKKSRRIARIRKAMGESPQHNADELVEAKSNDRFLKLFENPNPQDTLQGLLAQWMIQKNLTGSTDLWARPSRLEFPCELYIFPTALMYPIVFSEAYPFGAWRLQNYYLNGIFGILPSPSSGGGVILDNREIKRDRKPHPLWRWDGYSPLTAGGVQLDVLESIDQARKAMMDNGVWPSGIVSLPGASEAELIRFQNDLRNNHGGSSNVQQILATNAPEGAGFKPFSMTGRELEFDKGWEQMVKFVLALFGVPPTVAGLVDAGSYSQLYASLKQFHALTLLPELQEIARFLTKHVVRPYDEDAVVQIDLPEVDDKSVYDVQLKTDADLGTITINEYRGARGRKPVPWGDTPVGQQQQPDPMQQPGMDAGMGQDAGSGDEGADAVGQAAVDFLTGGDDVGAVQKAGRFDESKHKRGNTKNKGQFSSGGGGGSSGGASNSPKTNPAGPQSPAGSPQRGLGQRALGAAEGFANAVSAPFKPFADFIDWFNESGNPPFGEAASRFAWALTRTFGQGDRLAHLWDGKPASKQAATEKVQQAAQTLKQNPAVAQSVFQPQSKTQAWVQDQARRGAAQVAAKLRISPADAEAVLKATISVLIAEIRAGGSPNATHRLAGPGGRGVNVSVRRKSGMGRPSNPSGSGSLPPRKLVKSFLRTVLKELA